MEVGVAMGVAVAGGGGGGVEVGASGPNGVAVAVESSPAVTNGGRMLAGATASALASVLHAPASSSNPISAASTRPKPGLNFHSLRGVFMYVSTPQLPTWFPVCVVICYVPD
jgi:hypothetical protein